MKSNLNDPIRSQESGDDFSDYVAHLQLHMALQARNLVPRITSAQNSREKLLQDTQADFEKVVSRHVHSSDSVS